MHDIFVLMAKYVYEDKAGKPIGIDGRIRVNYFLDLLSAAHDKDSLELFSLDFVKDILLNVELDEISGVVSPKFGNVLFGKKVAEILNKKSGFVREGVLFGKWVEGEFMSGDKVLLVDDIASDGEILTEAVQNLKKAGIYVERMCAFVDRSEGDAHMHLSSENIDYSFKYKLSDEDLKKIKNHTYEYT